MTKVTLDDVEYDSKNFNVEQNKLLSELVQNNNIKTNLEYQLSSLEVVAGLLMRKLKKSLAEEITDDN